ncbi:hypothetical protein R1flu_011280 [Riccia fluitans]|uniref:Uncharacterized protein n=1 Tax=Riccia fluitans TaxID=41844 RepID=A0ABD1Z7D0_9MARC
MKREKTEDTASCSISTFGESYGIVSVTKRAEEDSLALATKIPSLPHSLAPSRLSRHSRHAAGPGSRGCERFMKQRLSSPLRPGPPSLSRSPPAEGAVGREERQRRGC